MVKRPHIDPTRFGHLHWLKCDELVDEDLLILSEKGGGSEGSKDDAKQYRYVMIRTNGPKHWGKIASVRGRNQYLLSSNPPFGEARLL